MSQKYCGVAEKDGTENNSTNSVTVCFSKQSPLFPPCSTKIACTSVDVILNSRFYNKFAEPNWVQRLMLQEHWVTNHQEVEFCSEWAKCFRHWIPSNEFWWIILEYITNEEKIEIKLGIQFTFVTVFTYMAQTSENRCSINFPMSVPGTQYARSISKASQNITQKNRNNENMEAFWRKMSRLESRKKKIHTNSTQNWNASRTRTWSKWPWWRRPWWFKCPAFFLLLSVSLNIICL